MFSGDKAVRLTPDPVKPQTDTEKYTTYKNESILSLGTLLVVVEIVLYILHRRRMISSYNRKFYESVLDKAMFCQVLYTFLTLRAGNAARIVFYFSVLSMMPLGYMFNTLNKTQFSLRNKNLTVTINQLFVIAYSLAMFIRIMANNGFGQLPYRFWY